MHSKYDNMFTDISCCILFLLHAFRHCQLVSVVPSVVLFNESAYRNEMMELLRKQPSSGSESYFKDAEAQGYFKTQNYPDKNGHKVIMDKYFSWCLEPFDKLNCTFALMETQAAVWQVQRTALAPRCNTTKVSEVMVWFGERDECKKSVFLGSWFMLKIAPVCASCLHMRGT